jgi:hypothetical protein
MTGTQSRKSEREIMVLQTEYRHLKEQNQRIIQLLTGNSIINIAVVVTLIISLAG